MPTESDLLLTKLAVPSQRTRNVSRARLTQLLGAGMLLKLTTVVAPAGYGKTTLLQEWIRTDLSGSRHAAWVSLDAYDNNALRFWSYLVAALKHACPALDYDLNCILEDSQAVEDYFELDLLLNAISRVPSSLCLVLDDYHEINNSSVHEMIFYFIKHAPDNLHVILSSRVTPPMPLSRLRSQQQLLELSAQDLAFTSAETEAFLSDVMKLTLDDREVASLLQDTQGWIVGLQFAALSMRDRHSDRPSVARVSGSNHLTLEYLTEEVLGQLPVGTRDFLLKTSVLSKFSAALCDAVVGRTGSQAVLDGIENSRLFIESLGEDRGWYRYHTLFADALRVVLARESPELVPELNRKACSWLRENGYGESAVSHALAAGELELAAEIAEGCGMEAVAKLHLVTLVRWIDQFPEDLILRRPRLGIYYALACFDLGRFHLIERKLRLVEAGLQQTKDCGVASGSEQEAYAEVAAIRAAVACVEGDCTTGIALAQNVIEGVSNQNAIVVGLNQDSAYAYESAWDLEAAAAAFERVCRLPFRLGSPRQVVRLCEIARIRKKQGRLDEAKRTYESALQHVCSIA